MPLFTSGTLRTTHSPRNMSAVSAQSIVQEIDNKTEKVAVVTGASSGRSSSENLLNAFVLSNLGRYWNVER